MFSLSTMDGIIPNRMFGSALLHIGVGWSYKMGSLIAMMLHLVLQIGILVSGVPALVTKELLLVILLVIRTWLIVVLLRVPCRSDHGLLEAA